MKHAVFVLVLLLMAYFAWQVFDNRERRGVIRTTKTHAPKLLLLTAIVAVFLVAAFYIPAIKLL